MEEKNSGSSFKVTITTRSGEEFIVPKEGSLGLLAMGYKGLMAWREARGIDLKAPKHQENNNG